VIWHVSPPRPGRGGGGEWKSHMHVQPCVLAQDSTCWPWQSTQMGDNPIKVENKQIETWTDLVYCTTKKVKRTVVYRWIIEHAVEALVDGY
jgi:hypothetical protein